MKLVKWYSLNTPVEAAVTDDAYAFLVGSAFQAWPMSLPAAVAWFAYMLGTREARAMKKRKRPPPRGKGYRMDVEARSTELARAALAELLTHQLIFVTDVDFHNRLQPVERPLDPEVTYYSLGSVAENLRGPGKRTA